MPRLKVDCLVVTALDIPFFFHVARTQQAFQVVSLDGWQQVMWHTQDTAGEGTWIFFVVLLVLGNVIFVSVSALTLGRMLRSLLRFS